MARTKCVMFFEDSLQHSWSEEFFIEANSDDAALVHFDLKNPDNIVGPRLALLARNYYLIQARVGNDEQDRDSLIAAYSFADGQGQNPVSGDYEQAWDALLVRCNGGAQHRRAYKLAGLPRGVVSGNGAYQPSPTWIPRFDTWRNTMLQKVHAQIRTQTPLVQVFGLTTIGASGKYITLAFENPLIDPGWSPGQYIKLRGYSGISDINGLWRVKYKNGRTYVMYPRRKEMFGTITVIGDVIPIAINMTPITSFIPLRGSKRKTSKRPINA